jgi:hypothetical protein
MSDIAPATIGATLHDRSITLSPSPAHCHVPVCTCIGNSPRVQPTQAPGAIMQHHMAEHIAIDTKMALTRATLIPCALTRMLLSILIIILHYLPICMSVKHTSRGRLPLFLERSCSQLLLRRHRRESSETAHAVPGVFLARPLPGHRGPVAQGE